MNELVRFAMVAFYPRVGDLPGLAELGVDEKIARLRRETTPLFWAGIVLATLFFHLSPVLTLHKPLPATFLSEQELDDHAFRLGTHRVYLVRQIVMLLKLMAGVFWGESDAIRAAMHLPAYGPDPGTRRMESNVVPRPMLPRAPTPALVQLGLRERERGRTHGATDPRKPADGAR